MIVISHPTGNQNFRNAAEAFYKNNQLARLFTALYWDKDSILSRYLPSSLSVELTKRSYPSIPKRFIAAYPYFELGRLVSKKIGLNSLTSHNSGFFSVDKVYRSFDSHVAKQLPNISDLSSVYCYEDGALQSFKAAKILGAKTTYELPIGYWRAARQILGEEAELNPEWASTIVSTKDSSEKLERKDQEIKLADRIIVPSQFVAGTLKLFEDDISHKIHIVPYGSPKLAESINHAKDEKLKVLFVGGLSQRKGLSYLFDAIDLVQAKVSLTVIGNKITNDCTILNKQLSKHRYISGLPHQEVLNEMHKHDVLVFPSLFEGFGLVILEAMAQGIPVIATINAGPGDIIEDGENGYIIPIRSSEAIAEKLELLAADRALLDNLKCAALSTAQRASWENYQNNLIHALS